VSRFKLVKPFAIAVCSALILMATACKSPSASIADQAKNLGVYTYDGSHVSDLSTYGKPKMEKWITEKSYWEIAYQFSDPIPTVPSDVSFIVNLQNADISGIKVFRVPDVKKAFWALSMSDDIGPKAVKSNTEPLSNGIYKVTPTEAGNDSAPYLCLFVRMPLENSLRLYAVQIKK